MSELLLSIRFELTDDEVQSIHMKIVPKVFWEQFKKCVENKSFNYNTQCSWSSSPREYQGEEINQHGFVKKVEVIDNIEKIAAFRVLFGEDHYTNHKLIDEFLDLFEENTFIIKELDRKYAPIDCTDIDILGNEPKHCPECEEERGKSTVRKMIIKKYDDSESEEEVEEDTDKEEDQYEEIEVKDMPNYYLCSKKHKFRCYSQFSYYKSENPNVKFTNGTLDRINWVKLKGHNTFTNQSEKKRVKGKILTSESDAESEYEYIEEEKKEESLKTRYRILLRNITNQCIISDCKEQLSTYSRLHCNAHLNEEIYLKC